MQVIQEDGKLYVHQKEYIKKLLGIYGMEECNAVASPIDVNIKLEACEESERIDAGIYQELIG